MPATKNPHQEIDGIKFYRKPTGYYQCNTRGLRAYAHRYVWEREYGPIPDGHAVHHVDHDKSNNAVENLQLMSLSDHSQHHAVDRVSRGEHVPPSALALERAAEWHRSPEGVAWHTEHGARTWVDREVLTHVCAWCGKDYEAKRGARKKGFCSMSCQGMARAASGVDDVDRTCTQCGTAFRSNKYRASKVCSNRCAGKASAEARRLRAGSG